MVAAGRDPVAAARATAVTHDRPTLHLTNWASRSLHGPGRRWTIMAAPRRFERGDGVVPDFTPPLSLLRQLKAERVTEDAYFAELTRRWDAGWVRDGSNPFSPRRLLASPALGEWVVVADGDSLLCSCSREKAAVGRCHRATAAPFLFRAGWRVILDGVEVTT